MNNDYDRKFVNFVLKPHLENINGYKVHLNDNDILPGAGTIIFLLYYLYYAHESRSRIIVLFSSFMTYFDLCNLGFLGSIFALLSFLVPYRNVQL